MRDMVDISMPPCWVDLDLISLDKYNNSILLYIINKIK